MAGTNPLIECRVPVEEPEAGFRSEHRELIVELLEDVLIKAPVRRDSQKLAVAAQIECARDARRNRRCVDDLRRGIARSGLLLPSHAEVERNAANLELVECKERSVAPV